MCLTESGQAVLLDPSFWVAMAYSVVAVSLALWAKALLTVSRATAEAARAAAADAATCRCTIIGLNACQHVGSIPASMFESAKAGPLLKIVMPLPF